MHTFFLMVDPCRVTANSYIMSKKQTGVIGRAEHTVVVFSSVSTAGADEDEENDDGRQDDSSSARR